MADPVRVIDDHDKYSGIFLYAENTASTGFTSAISEKAAERIKAAEHIRGVCLRISFRALSDMIRGQYNLQGDADDIIHTTIQRLCLDASGQPTGKTILLELAWSNQSSTSDAGRMLPAYMLDERRYPQFEGGQYALTAAGGPAAGRRKLYPRFWIPAVAAELAAIVRALGAKYGDNPFIAGVGAVEFPGVPTVGRSLETRTRWTPDLTYDAADVFLSALTEAFPRKVVSIFLNHPFGIPNDRGTRTEPGAKTWGALLEKFCAGRGLGLGTPDIAATRQSGGRLDPYNPQHSQMAWAYQRYAGLVPIVFGAQKPSSRNLLGPAPQTPQSTCDWVYEQAAGPLKCYQVKQAMVSGGAGGSIYGWRETIETARRRGGLLWSLDGESPALPELIARAPKPEPGDRKTPRAERVLRLTRPGVLTAEDLASYSAAERKQLITQLSALSSRLEG
jgi:hypothetical protein